MRALEVDAEELQRLLSGRQERDAKVSAVEHVAEAVRTNLRGCGVEGHQRAETAMCEVVRGVFNVTVLPERIREPFVRAMVTTHMHAHGDFQKGVSALFSEEFSRSLTLAATIAAVYEHPEWLQPEDRAAVNSVPVSTGQYV